MAVTALVLAAGSSSRMGRNKLLLELEGESLVRRAVRHAAAAPGVDHVLVVLGHEAERVRAELAGLPCGIVVNPDHARGFDTSLHAGLQAARDAEAVIVVLADMPHVTPAMIGTLAARHRATGAALVVSHYGDVQAPPTLFGRPLFAELLATTGERCAKEVVGRHRDEAVVVEWAEPARRDVDAPADYERVRRPGGKP